MKIVATTSLPVVDCPNTDCCNAARSCQNEKKLADIEKTLLPVVCLTAHHLQNIPSQLGISLNNVSAAIWHEENIKRSVKMADKYSFISPHTKNFATEKYFIFQLFQIKVQIRGELSIWPSISCPKRLEWLEEQEEGNPPPCYKHNSQVLQQQRTLVWIGLSVNWNMKFNKTSGW